MRKVNRAIYKDQRNKVKIMIIVAKQLPWKLREGLEKRCKKTANTIKTCIKHWKLYMRNKNVLKLERKDQSGIILAKEDEVMGSWG